MRLIYLAQDIHICENIMWHENHFVYGTHVYSYMHRHQHMYKLVHKRMYWIRMNLRMLQPSNVFVTFECLYYAT